MKFTLSITCDNAAFHGEDGEEGETEQPSPDMQAEVAGILYGLAERLEVEGPTGGRLFDTNGNGVGRFDYTEEG